MDGVHCEYFLLFERTSCRQRAKFKRRIFSYTEFIDLLCVTRGKMGLKIVFWKPKTINMKGERSKNSRDQIYGRS